MEWNKEQTMRLIQAFKEKELLWNALNEDYKDRTKKNEAWKEIANIFNVERSDIEKKVRNLIGQFHRELKRNPAKTDDEDDGERSKWFAFKALLFLRNKPRVQRMREIKVEYNEDDVDTIEGEEFHCSASEIDYDSSMMLQHRQTVKRKRETIEPYEVMESTFNSTNPTERDDCQIFGEYIASKIRRLRTEYAKNTVQHLINNILYDAFLGKYDAPPYDNNPSGESSGY